MTAPQPPSSRITVREHLRPVADVPEGAADPYVHGSCVGEPVNWWVGPDGAERDDLKRLCAGCPAKAPCLELGLERLGAKPNGNSNAAIKKREQRRIHNPNPVVQGFLPDGIWGGKNHAERTAIERERKNA